MSTRYFTSDQFEPPTLLRSVDFVEEAFVDDQWRPTKMIANYLYGNDDFVDDIAEADARVRFPQAF